MSWSVSALGKAPAVRKAIAAQFAQGSKCMEPEETIRQAAAAILDSSLAEQLPTIVVKVNASGSMSRNYDTKENIQNNLSLVVEPQYGFLE